jgi:asparagine synthase (glutamine-hydrolysing)
MCGIYGRVGPRNDDLDRRATLALRHRGPDDAGLAVDLRGLQGHPVILGHTRLSVLDLSPAGHQPMVSADGRYVLAFNGEIYNFLALRKKLEAQGRVFVSHTDTETLLHMYDLHGDAMLDHVEGMYALALWDRFEHRLLLARDPSGIKPLFWRQEPAGRIAFASEIKALLVDPQVVRVPDLRALAGYLSYLYVPPPATAFQGVQRLLPGHKLVLDATGQRIERFHRYAIAPKLTFRNETAAVDALDQLLREVIAEHVVADVPVGAFLSGGIDSGLIVAIMARLQRERGGGQVRTFTVGFGQEGQHLDESARAAQVAAQLGVQHRILRVSADLATDRFRHIAGQLDEPFGNPTALMTDALCEGARQEVTVALTGDGGDEAFAGYPRYRATWILSAWRHLPERVRDRWLPELAERLPERSGGMPLLRHARRFLRASGGSFADTYRDWLGHYTPTDLRGLLTDHALAAVLLPGGAMPEDLGQTVATIRSLGPDADPLDAACYADVNGFLPDNVLQLSDRMSMRHALELRVPLADRRVVDFGLRLPPTLKMGPAALLGSSGKTASKRLLRAVAARYLKPASVGLKKQGFVAPMGTWLAGPLQGLLDEALDPATLARRGVVRPEVVATMRAEHLAGTRDHTWHLWSLVVLESWFRQRVDRLDLPETPANVHVEVRVLG